MTLREPFKISARLLPALQVGTAWLNLEYAGESGGRTRYRWTIDLPDSEHTGDDLKSGVGGGDLQSGFASLLSFLSAAGESFTYRERTGRNGDNEDLFPVAVMQWAAANTDELSLLRMEIEESETPLIEEGL